jgi:hypothetical protein
MKTTHVKIPYEILIRFSEARALKGARRPAGRDARRARAGTARPTGTQAGTS